MKFKEWFYAAEMRKPYRDYMSRMFPNMPNAVRHELGTNTIIPQLKKIASNSTSNASNLGATVNYSPNRAASPMASTVMQPVQSKYNSPNSMMQQDEKIQKFQDTDWPESPEIVEI